MRFPRSNFMRLLVASGPLLACLCEPVLPAVEGAAPAYERPSAVALLPADAAVALHCPRVGAWRQALADSDFGKFWAEEEVRRFFGPLADASLEKIAELRKGVPGIPEWADLENAFGEAALALTLPERLAEGAQPRVCAAFKVADLKAVERLLAPLLRQQPLAEGKVVPLPGAPPEAGAGLVYEQGWLLLANTGAALEELRARLKASEKKEGALASAPAWKDAQRLLDGPGLLTVFFAVPPILKQALDRLEEKEAPLLVKLVAQTGFSGVRALALRAGARGPVLSLDVALAWDAPPTSLLARALKPLPLPPAALQAVPEETACCSAHRLDLAGLLESIRGLLEADKRKELDEGLARAAQQLGVDLEQDVLASLGDTWLTYDVGGSEFMGLYPGMALSLSLKDGRTLEKALKNLLNHAEPLLAGARRSMGMEMSLHEVRLGEIPVRYLNITPLPFSPSFAVAQDRLLVTLSVGSMRRALRQLDAPRNVTSNPAFKDALQRVLGKDPAAGALPGEFSYSNPLRSRTSLGVLAQVAKMIQGGMQMNSQRMAAGGGPADPVERTVLDLLGKLDFALFPSDEAMNRHLRPTASVLLNLDGGTVIRSDLSLPSAQTFSQGSLFTTSFMAGLTLPVLARARESARRTACASNLSQIGKACAMFADVAANEGKYPKRLDELFDAYIKDKRCFLCPSVGQDAHGPGLGAVKHCDYLYLPGADPAQDRSMLAFCRDKNHGARQGRGLGRNVLFSDGSVEWLDNDEAFKKQVLETLKRNKLSIELPQAAAAKPMTPLTPELEKKLLQAVKDLSSDDFATREAAMKVLSAAGESARPVLSAGLKSQDLETQNRCKETLSQMDAGKNMSAEDRAWIESLRRELGLEEKK